MAPKLFLHRPCPDKIFKNTMTTSLSLIFFDVHRAAHVHQTEGRRVPELENSPFESRGRRFGSGSGTFFEMKNENVPTISRIGGGFSS